jgi:hypothetical protein
MRASLCIASLSLVLTGCITTPSFDQISGVRPNTIVDTIQCELIAARARIETLRAREKTSSKKIRSLCEFVVVADLSLQVDEQMVLAPSFAHTDVVSKSLTRAFDWGLKLDTQAQRTFAQSVTFTIRDLKEPEKGCSSKGVSLNGNLGLVEAVEMGLTTVDPTASGVVFSADYRDEGKNRVRTDCPQYASQYSERSYARRGKGGDRGGDGRQKNAFSTQIEFVLLRSVNSTGPTWTLQNFRGPGKLFSTQRTDTHSVTVAFAFDEGEAAKQSQKSTLDSLKNNLRLLQRAP